MRSPDATEFDDDTLLARARTGDRVAFGELVRRHQRAALRLAAVISGSTEEANDIVQDAMVNVHRALGSYRGHAPVRSWMLRIVANHAKNHVRSSVRRSRRDDRHARLDVGVVDGADDAVVRQAEYRELAQALTRLRTADREILACRFVTELSEAETADVLALPIGTVKSRTSRALERLRAELGEVAR